MRTCVLLFVAALNAFACNADPVATTKSSNPEISVELLFEHDGCRVYRFTDVYKRYYVRCPGGGEVASTHTEYCGKNCQHTVNDAIPTVNE